MTSILLSSDSIFECYNNNIIYNGSLYTLPIKIQTDNKSNIKLVFKFMTDIIDNNNYYFIIDGSNITIDGLNSIIDISVNNYNGLFQQNNIDIEDIIIQNFNIKSNNGCLAMNAGWLCNTYLQNCTVNNCISSGNIDRGCNGGIFGSNCFNCVANECYTTDLIGSINNYNNSGIFGNSCMNCSANNCYSLGDIYGDNDGFNGGIYGTNSENCIASNCFSNGSIGIRCGGIFSTAINCEAINCYSLGEINIQGGGIFGVNADDSDAINCYSLGKIYDYSDGIYGVSAQSSCANNCYSIGDIDNYAGGIYGAFSQSVDAINCYTSDIRCNNIQNEPLTNIQNNDNITGIYGQTPTDINIINCYSESISGWNDINALSFLNNINTIWISFENNTPFFLSSFSKQLYEPNIILSNTPNYISNNGILTHFDYYIINVNDTIVPHNINIDMLTGKITFIDCKPSIYIIKILAISDYCYFYDKYTFILINDNNIINSITSNNKIIQQDNKIIQQDNKIIQQDNKIIQQDNVVSSSLFNKLIENSQQKKKFNLKKH
jgi:hypothetical protein